MRYNVLCIDEMGTVRYEFARMLKNRNIKFIGADDEKDAISILKEGKTVINAIVWTMNTPDEKSFETVRALKNTQLSKDIPLIVVSEHTNKKHIIKAVKAGVAEYIARPYDEKTVLDKMCRILGIPCEKDFKPMDEDIVVYTFHEMLSREVKAAARGNHKLTVLMARIASESLLADERDRERLEEVLSMMNKVMKTIVRETDTIFQYGKDSLVLLLPFANQEGACTVERKMTELFYSHSLLKQKNTGFKLLSASVTYPEDGKTKDRLLEKLEASFAPER